MRKLIFLSLLCLFSFVNGWAQNTTAISGKVIDETGYGIPGAAILVKGTTIGTIADVDGNYKLNVPEGTTTLVFKFIGMEDQEVAIDGRTTIDAVMKTDSKMLDETIVVAYGTSTRNSFTGSAAVVDAEVIEKKVNTNVTSALAGTVPGLTLLQTSGDPTGNAATIRVRGIGSMNASNSPLIVVDGVPYDGSISEINPQDVESQSVLKDASAAAIYGHRASNGVILITTKKGKVGDAKIKFEAKWGSNSRLIPQYDVIDDPAQYYETWYKKLYNQYYYAGHSVDESYAFADAVLYDEKNGGLGYQIFTLPEGEKLVGSNFKINPNAKLGYTDGEYTYIPDDWYDEVYGNGSRQEYTFSASGANEKFNYFSSFSYLKDNGVVENSDYQRFTGRLNVEYQAKTWMKIVGNANYTHTDSQLSHGYTINFGSSGNLFYIVNNIAPIYPLYVRDADGNIMHSDDGSPVYDAKQTNFQRANFAGNAVRDNHYNRKKNLVDVISAKYGMILTPIEGLSLNGNISIMSRNKRYNYLYSVFSSQSTTDGAVEVESDRLFTFNQQYLAEYKKTFADLHNIDVLAGYEMYRRTEQYVYGYNDRLFSPYIGELNNADGTASKLLESSTDTYMTQGILARVNYDYNGRYFLNASYRRDESSRFAEGHRWGDFWSVGGAWLMSEEDFLKNVDVIDMMKIKVSYGLLGNDNMINSAGKSIYYAYQDQYTHTYSEDAGTYSLELTYKGNEDLTWETNKEFNVGLEFGLLGGRLNGGVDFFTRETVDLLYNNPVPLSSGNPTGYFTMNVGSMKNTGVEASFDGYIIRTKNVNWTWNLNLTHYKNEITDLHENVAENGIVGSNYWWKIGGSYYNTYMYKYAGVDKETGEAQYYYEGTDEKGNPATLTTKTFDEADRYECGTTIPDLQGGFGTAIDFYGFDFSVQFSYQLGGQFYDGTYQAFMHTQNNPGQNIHKDILRAWTPENPNTDVPRWDGDAQVAQSPVDRFMIKASYLSMNNATLGYTYRTKDKKIFDSARIFITGDNLFVSTKRKGMDPRFSMGMGSYTSGAGLNSGAYPTSRNITGGVTITF